MTLTSVGTNLWIAEQPLRFLGLEVGARMSVVRIRDGTLALISPIEMNDALLAAIHALGVVSHLIAPNRFHHLFLPKAIRHFSKAKVLGVPGLDQKRPEVRFDELLDAPGSLDEELSYRPFEGVCAVFPGGIENLNEVVFFHRPSRTLVLADTAFNFGPQSAPITRLAGRLLGCYGRLQPSRLEKWGSRNKAQVEASVRAILQWRFDQVIPAHGAVVAEGGWEQLRAGYAWLLEQPLDDPALVSPPQ